MRHNRRTRVVSMYQTRLQLAFVPHIARRHVNMWRRADQSLSRNNTRMSQDQPNPFLDRYLPNATAEQQKEACENVSAFARVLALIDERLEREKAIRVKQDGEVDSK